jgi:hypothetical protein
MARRFTSPQHEIQRHLAQHQPRAIVKIVALWFGCGLVSRARGNGPTISAQ